MKQRKYKNVHELLDDIEKNMSTPSELRWIKNLKRKTRIEEKKLEKMSRKEVMEKFKDDLIKLDNSIYDLQQFLWICKTQNKCLKKTKGKLISF